MKVKDTPKAKQGVCEYCDEPVSPRFGGIHKHVRVNGDKDAASFPGGVARIILCMPCYEDYYH